MKRRDFLKFAGCAVGAVATTQTTAGAEADFVLPASALANEGRYGLLECADSNILAAMSRSRHGILRCTVNDHTHCCDAGLRWGTPNALNDLYFGLHGGLFIGDSFQHTVFRNELRAIAKFIAVHPDRPPVPWSVKADGTTPRFNTDPGADLDRCAQFVLEVVRTYELTGDRKFAEDLYPSCRLVVDYLAGRDLDGDLLPEGSLHLFPGPIGPGGQAGSSITYIGDTCANAWKDFGAALFYYVTLQRLALLENILGKISDATNHLQQAARVREAAQRILWNEPTKGFLAWVEKNGARHDDWITGNNLHAVACGLASADQSRKILQKLEEHRAEIEEIVPCRVRIGLFEPRLCSNGPDYYWNGGIWTLVAAPDMLARARMNDVAGALRVAELLSTRPEVTDVGFYEAYDGKTGKPNNCRGLLMNNGGFVWGFFEAVMGIDVEGDELRFRASIPKSVVPSRARFHYRDSDLEVRWLTGKKASATLDGKQLKQNDQGYYPLNLIPKPKQTYHLEIICKDSFHGGSRHDSQFFPP